MMNIYWIYYYLLVNALAFLVAGADKMKAVNQMWRIKESRLHLLSFLGGVFGMALAMKLFHHKINKKNFVAITALAATLHVIIILYTTLY
jgi:uncharacterized membrane protein YsdA (DUF1294 family)